MKITKKVLSVLLAIAMVLGTFAVAASANGNKDTATHQVKYWLTASPITAGAEWTSKTDYTAATWTDSQTGNMEVEPGQKVMIAVHVTTNYYVGHVAGLVFFDDRLLDGAEFYKAETGYDATTARRNKMIFYNSKNEFVRYCVQSNYVMALSSMALNEALVGEVNKILDDDGKIAKTLKADGAAFTTADEFRATGWSFFKFDNWANPENEETIILEDGDECYVYFPVQVPNDAQPGDTYKFTMLEETIRRKANTLGNMYVSECPDGAADATNMSNVSYQYFDTDQYFDLSGTQITLTVKGEAAELDYSALQAYYNSVKDTVVANYDNTSAFTSALAAAADMLTNQNAADQNAIDSAKTALENGFKAMTIKSADYTKLTSAKTAAAVISADNYEQDANWTAFQSALSAANAIATGLDITHQSEIDAAATNLTNAIANLTPKVVENDADYSALNAAIAEAETFVAANQSEWYTAETWSAFTSALAAAKAVPEGLKESSQSVIDTAKKNLVDAKNALTEAAADYTAVNAAKAKVPAESDLTNYYTTDSVAAVKAAIAAVVEGKNKKDQSVVDGYAAAIEAAVSALKLIDADKTELAVSIAKADAVNATMFTAESYNAMKTALDAAKALNDAEGLTKKDNQAQIDAAKAALDDAYGKLVPAGADYTKVNNAVSAYEALTASHWTAATWANATAAYNAAKTAQSTVYNKAQQAELDAIADALTLAIADLQPELASFTELDAAISKLNTLVTNYGTYMTDDYKASVTAAVEAAQDSEFRKTTAANQSKVDEKTAAINDLYNNPVYKAFDYSKINAAKAEYGAIDRSLYTEESLAIVDALFAGIKWDYTQNPTDNVNGYAPGMLQQSKVTKWKNSLVLKTVSNPADYSALNAAIASAEEVLAGDLSIYTDSSVTALRDALAAAKAVSKDLTEDDQATIDAAKNKLVAATTLTEKDADYTALNAAIALAGTKDEALYTEASWSAMQAKLAAANAVAKNLKASQQSVITKAANELNAAITALVLKPTETKGAITSVEWTPSSSTTNTFTLKINNVDGNYAAKVQFIDPDGNTRTYTRRHEAVSVTAYKADGTQCHELDREAAYEVWTINAKIRADVEIKAIAKYDYTWESIDNAYKFTVSLVAASLDTTVYSVTPAATSGKARRLNVTVVTGVDVQGVRMVMVDMDNATLTYKNGTVDGDLKTFNCQASAYADGVNTIKVQVKYGGEWHDADSFTYTVE